MKPLRRLRPGDRIALVAPASSFPPEEIEPGVAELRRLGFEAVYDNSIFEKAHFTAGTAEVRAKAIHTAWMDPSIAALIAVRGGYGSAQLLPLLDVDLMVSARKPLIGYSDITALLNLQVRSGLAAIHGPMIDRRFSKGPAAYHVDSFMKVVTAPEPAGEMRPDQLDSFQGGEHRGTLVGGTVAQLVASMGTPWAFDPPQGCVLFLEDIGERPYRVHRMLTQLAQSGILARAGAVVFGEFPGCDEPGGAGPAIRDVLQEFAKGLNGPVLFNFPSGHTKGATWTVPFGVDAVVTGGSAARLSILEAAVE